MFRFVFNKGPENEDDDEEEEDIEEESIDESEEEETMPPKKSSKTDANAAKPSSKKKKPAGASAIQNNPFSPFLLINYKQVRYTLGNGESYTDVNLYGIGYSDPDDFKFNLVGESNLSFACRKKKERVSRMTVRLLHMPTWHAPSTLNSTPTPTPKVPTSHHPKLLHSRSPARELWTGGELPCLLCISSPPTMGRSTNSS
jgi:hypothetical protein